MHFYEMVVADFIGLGLIVGYEHKLESRGWGLAKIQRSTLAHQQCRRGETPPNFPAHRYDLPCCGFHTGVRYDRL